MRVAVIGLVFIKNNVMNLNNTKFVYSKNSYHVKKSGDASWIDENCTQNRKIDLFYSNVYLYQDLKIADYLLM